MPLIKFNQGQAMEPMKRVQSGIQSGLALRDMLEKMKKRRAGLSGTMITGEGPAPGAEGVSMDQYTQMMG